MEGFIHKKAYRTVVSRVGRTEAPGELKDFMLI
jgi:hypothetical protein